MSYQDKIEAHKRFWHGEGPCLILIPTGKSETHDLGNYSQLFRDPALMWEAEMRHARSVVDWPTDGIPTVRPNLGVVFIPSMAGQSYLVRDGQMPWLLDRPDRDAIRAIKETNLAETELMRLAVGFYGAHRERGTTEVVAYHPDTQGVFDIAHLLEGTDMLLQMLDEPEWVHELLEISLDLYIQVSQYVKGLLGEKSHSMIHGHSTPQGVYFPHAGVRISEDSPTLLSPAMIDEFVMPYVERSLEPFGGGFVHYCGRHEYLFERLCRCPRVRAIDLGNPEMYDHRWLFERCAEHDVVLHSRLTSKEDEEWPAYVRRLAGHVRETGSRCILRPLVSPESREECAAMLDLWHDLTC